MRPPRRRRRVWDRVPPQIVSVVLGLVSLTGGWVGTVASARAEITGQIEMQAATNATVATQLQAVYGDAWQASALWGGIFALVGLLVGVAVLVRPAFGDPDQVQTPWIKSVAWAGCRGRLHRAGARRPEVLRHPAGAAEHLTPAWAGRLLRGLRPVVGIPTAGLRPLTRSRCGTLPMWPPRLGDEG